MANAQKSSDKLWIVVVIMLAIILLCTRVVDLGDTRVYAKDIVLNLGKSPFGPENSLWEPGHLLWRPLGWLLLSAATPALSAVTDWTPFMQATFMLTAVSVICALIVVALWYLMIARITGSRAVAFGITIAMACSHGFLLRVPSGSAYLPGLLCLTLSLYFLGRRRIIPSAMLYAVSSLLWLPFILVGLALVLLAACPFWSWNKPLREIFAKIDWPSTIRFVVVSSAMVLLAFGFALYARRTASLDEAAKWYHSGRHGYAYNKNIIRIATGFPRSFLYLARDGILYKRFLMHDPYAPVTVWDIARASLWKLAIFYLFGASLLYELLRPPRSAWLLLLVTAGVAPVVLFAIIVLETGSPERYVPALPFLVLATAWVLRDFAEKRRITQLVIAGFLVCVVVSNIDSFAAPRVSAENSASLSRVAELRNRLTGTSLVMVTTNQDVLESVLARLAFDKINRPTPIPIYDVIETANVRIATWRHDMAVLTLKTWGSGGDVWVSKRLWSAAPLPSWNWVEGDDPLISWKDLPPFFSKLHTDADCGGPDGFLRIERDENNLALLRSLAAADGSSSNKFPGKAGGL